MQYPKWRKPESSGFAIVWFYLYSILKSILEKEKVTHSSIFAWRTPWTEEPGGSTGLQRVRHDWVTSLTYSLTQIYAAL